MIYVFFIKLTFIYIAISPCLKKFELSNKFPLGNVTSMLYCSIETYKGKSCFLNYFLSLLGSDKSRWCNLFSFIYNEKQ